jgi:hypothetical protein
MDWHEGPNISKIPVKGVMGAVFTVGIVLMFLVGVPHARLFVLITVPLGVVVGIVLYLWHKRKPVEYTDIDPHDPP